MSAWIAACSVPPVLGWTPPLGCPVAGAAVAAGAAAVAATDEAGGAGGAQAASNAAPEPARTRRKALRRLSATRTASDINWGRTVWTEATEGAEWRQVQLRHRRRRTRHAKAGVRELTGRQPLRRWTTPGYRSTRRRARSRTEVFQWSRTI